MSQSHSSSSFDKDIEKATPDSSGEADWSKILEIGDKAGQSASNAQECLKAIMKRLNSAPANSQRHTLTLLDSCIKNCGASFRKEVATPEFVRDSRTFLSKASSELGDKYKELLKQWADTEFKSDSNLSAIPTFYQNLRKEGAYFGLSTSSPAVTKLSSSQPTSNSGMDSDLEKAIALSLKDSQGKATTTSLYPQMSNMVSQSTYQSPSPQMPSSSTGLAEKSAKALYDFEAAEDNELTFKTGEMITVLDDSDPNWWRGKTWRGEGLFPANFVTLSLLSDGNEAPESGRKTVQFNEEVVIEQFDPDKVRIDESVIDQALEQIQNADPTGLTEDSQEMVNLEEECKAMVPLIDGELEQVDKKHNELMMLNQKLIDSFQMYTKLMTEVPQYSTPNKYMYSGGAAASASVPLPQQQMPPQQNYQSGPTPSVYPVPDPQNYYATGGSTMYGAPNVPSATQPDSHQADLNMQQPQYSQAAMLQQYQPSATNFNSIPYVPNSGGMQNLSQQGYQPGYPAVPNQPMS